MNQYKRYKNSHLIVDWEALVEQDEDYIKELYQEWLEVEEYNNKVRREHYDEKWERIGEIRDVLRKNGIEHGKYSGTGTNRRLTGYYSWFSNNVMKKIEQEYPKMPSMPYAHMDTREVYGHTIRNNQSPTNLVELYTRVKRDFNVLNRKETKSNKLFKESVKYANKYDIGINDLLPDEIVQKVQEVAKARYESENIQPGMELYLKHECGECSTYIVGERRCECGNRRISVVIEGDILDGFTYYTEPY